MELQDFNPHERIVAAEADLQRRLRLRRRTGLGLFVFVTVVLVYVWHVTTVGERACVAWIEKGKPRLIALTIKMDSHWNRTEVNCSDREAVQYFESCLEAAASWDPTANSYWRNDCIVVLRFDNGAEYRSPGLCMITADGIRLALPAESKRPMHYAFQEPMPDSWKHVLNTLLGPGTID